MREPRVSASRRAALAAGTIENHLIPDAICDHLSRCRMWEFDHAEKLSYKKDVGDLLSRDVELVCGCGLGQATFDHAPHHCLPTFRRQRPSLVAVHLPLGNTEASQPRLPGPDQTDNLLKAKPAAGNACGGPVVVAHRCRVSGCDRYLGPDRYHGHCRDRRRRHQRRSIQ